MSTPKHTGEPWKAVEEVNGWAIKDNHGNVIASHMNNGRDMGEADAARTVECVNDFSGIENPEEYIDDLKQSRGAYKSQDQEIRLLINADKDESTFDEVNRLKNRYDALLEWKAQAQNGFRLMEEAHELLKSQYDKVVGEVQQLLVLHNAEQEGLQQPGVLQWIEAVQKVEQALQPGVLQWIQVVQKFGRALKEVEKAVKPRTTTDETSWEENRL
jgi:hypothetical protein